MVGKTLQHNLGAFVIILLFSVTLCVDHHKNSTTGKLMVCYYTATSYFPVSQVPADMCTHIIYAFGKVTKEGIQPTSPGDLINYKSLVQLKQKNPNLKLLLSLQKGFPSVVSGGSESNMTSFAQAAVAFLKMYGFDGVDLDWEFPSASDKNNYKKFIEILYNKTSGANMILSAALPNNPNRFTRGYDADSLSRYLDFMTAMSYDFHMFIKHVDNTTGYNSPLFTPKGESQFLSTSAILKYYLSMGIPASKLLMGIPIYGHSWKLANSSQHDLHAPALGRGNPGPYRHLKGIYVLPDVCVAFLNGAKNEIDEINGAAYLYLNSTWVSFDEPRVIQLKLSWLQSQNLGGVGVWAIHLDDNDGVCLKGKLPMLTLIKSGL